MGADSTVHSAAAVSINDAPADPVLARWFAPVLLHGARWAAPNLDTRCAFLRMREIELPLTVNEAEWDNSWVCSPYTHYVTYATEEIRGALGAGAPARAIAALATHLLAALGDRFRRGHLNRVVLVNNWLMSTNPWPAWDPAADRGATLRAALGALRERWPRHAIVFRSLNARADAPLLRALERHDARIVPSRHIWWFAQDSDAVRRSRNLRHDRRLLASADLDRVEHADLRPGDFDHLAGLYRQLYLEKYSRHNPAYTADWLRHLWREGLLRFTALREREPGNERYRPARTDGDPRSFPSQVEGPPRLVGVEARGVLHRTMVSPIVGYDLSIPSRAGLYRRLAAIPVLAARDQGVPLNLSAGVGRFKETRGGEPTMEYLAVFDRHLPAERRQPWAVIEAVSRYVLAPYVRRRRL